MNERNFSQYRKTINVACAIAYLATMAGISGQLGYKAGIAFENSRTENSGLIKQLNNIDVSEKGREPK